MHNPVSLREPADTFTSLLLSFPSMPSHTLPSETAAPWVTVSATADVDLPSCLPDEPICGLPCLCRQALCWGLCQGVDLETPADEARKRPEPCNGTRLGIKSPTPVPPDKVTVTQCGPGLVLGLG